MSAPHQPSGPVPPSTPQQPPPGASAPSYGPPQNQPHLPPPGPQQAAPQQAAPQQAAPQGPPPGYGYPPVGGWPGQPTQQLPAAPGASTVWVLGLISVIAVVAGLSISEGGHSGWDTVNAWGGLAIAGAVLSAAGAWGPSFGLRGARAPQLALVGAGLLALFWVLLVLPAVGSNTSLITTIGVLAGAAAAWRSQPAAAADGRHSGGQGPVW